MDSPLNGRQRSLALALVVLTAAVPLALAGPALAQGTCSDIDTVGYITLSHPLVEQVTATELAYLLVGPAHPTLTSQRHLTNGIDALVIDLGCDVGAATFLVEATGEGDCDPAVKFLTRDLQDNGLHNSGGGDTESGSVPSNTRYAVVILEDGPVFTNLTPGFPVRPYSCRIQFDMAI